MRRRGFRLPDAPLVRVTGSEVTARVETHPDPDEIDHVYLTMYVPGWDRVTVSVNTLSKRNRVAGFDPRVRVAVVREYCETLPEPGVEVVGRCDYSELEASRNLFFEHHDRTSAEALLLDLARGARLLEAWGMPYLNRAPGLHQIHSRRASCAVPEDVRGCDGGLRFFAFENHRATLVLFKFCGQA